MKCLNSFMCSLRFYFRNKLLTFINISGLGVGLAITMFLLVYLCYEFSYDRHFQDADRIFRFLTVVEENNGIEHIPASLKVLEERINREIPEVESVGRFYWNGAEMACPGKKERFSFSGGNVDSSFFHVFNFDLVYGTLEGGFVEPRQCVLVRSAAEMLFGKGVDPVGQYIEANQGEPWKVMAVIEDLPLNSHFNVKYFQPMTKRLDEYGGLEFFTYVKFRENIDLEETIAKCNALNKKLLHEHFDGEWTANFSSILEPLVSLHTSTLATYDLSPINKSSRLFFIVLVGILILGIALSNFISLFMIQGEKRSLEVGIRKVGGASRGKIVAMLFGETFFITFVAFLLALALYGLFADWLANLLEIYVPGFSWGKGNIFLIFATLYVVTALIAGSYPAWNLSRHQPAELIRKTVVRKFRLTMTSVIVQFTILIFCVSALWIVLRQLNYAMKQPFGFETENILGCLVRVNHEQAKSLGDELSKHACVASVGFARAPVEEGGSGECIGRVEQKDDIVSADVHDVDKGYLDALKIPLLEGTGFSGNKEEDEDKVILSATALDVLGIKEAVGKKILFSGEVATVIGIARDCRYGSAREGIGNVVYTSYRNDFRYLYVHFQPGTYEETRGVVNAEIKKYFPNMMVNMFLLKDNMTSYYNQDQVVVRMLKVGTGFAILLAALGLGALCGFVAQQKKKEIGIRRISGAYMEDIISLMLRYVLLRIIPAIPVGILASYFIMDHWLSDFKFAIAIPWWIYALTITFMFLLVTAIVVFRSWSVAHANPVEALTSE